MGELQLKDSKLYFGAVPPDFDGSRYQSLRSNSDFERFENVLTKVMLQCRFSTVGFQSFIGCMKDLQVETTPLDLLKYEAYGVDPGCSDRASFFSVWFRLHSPGSPSWLLIHI